MSRIEHIARLKRELAQIDGGFKNQRVVMTAKRPQGYVPKDRIATANDKARRAVNGNMRAFIAHNAMAFGWVDVVRALALPPLPTKTKAYINHGRWLADCPDPDCAGCETVEPIDPVYMCLSCGNAHTRRGQAGARLVMVEFPHPEILDKVIPLLLQRPRVFRNWIPQTESVQDILEENERNL